MNNLQMRFLAENELSPEVERQVEELDRLAFSGEDEDDPQLKDIRWATHEWMALGYYEQRLVVQFCLLTREIRVDGQPLEVAGVGGVATHPDWRHRGFATQLLGASVPFTKKHLAVTFGLLICAEETQPVYAACGWQAVAPSLLYWQDGQQHSLETVVMILPLSGQSWPTGEIDLAGLPW